MCCEYFSNIRPKICLDKLKKRANGNGNVRSDHGCDKCAKGDMHSKIKVL